MLSSRAPMLLSCLALCVLSACGGGGGSAPAVVQTGGGNDSGQTAQSTSLDLGAVAAQPLASTLPAQWYRDAVFAEVYLRAYQDSDGDGTGDINGLISRLDYLQGLGVKGIWLMPISRTAQHDHGYDVTDYRSLETEFGNEADLKRLIDAAHARGMGIVLDYVMNHSSSSNPLFHDSTYSLENKRNWYIWNSAQQPWGLWYGANKAYYYSSFTDFMPDFDLTNETVVQYHFNSMRKWLNLGIDGFRMDAVQNYVENSYLNENQPQTLALIQRIRTTIDQYPNRFMVCEDGPAPVLAVQSGCTSAFAFGLHASLVASAKTGKVDSALSSYITSADLPSLSPLLANHDTYFGIRLYDQFGGNEARYKLAAASLLTLPGTPFVYYGEEIGMSMASGAGNITDHRLRAPMSWTSAPVNAGFSTASPFRVLADNAATHNVELEAKDPNSLLSTYKQLIALRNAEVALRRGTLSQLATGNGAVLAFTRTQGSEKVLVVINYADTANTVSLALPAASTWAGRYPTGTASVTVDGAGKGSFALPATTAWVFKLN